MQRRGGDAGQRTWGMRSGRRAPVQPGWLLFSSRLSSLRQERMSSSPPQHGESRSRSWVRASASRPQARPLRGDSVGPEPSRTPARPAPLRGAHRAQGAICCVPSRPPRPESVSPGRDMQVGLGCDRQERWHCSCGQGAGTPHGSGRAGRAAPGHRSTPGWAQCKEHCKAQCRTLSLGHGPALPCSSFE